MKCSKCGYDLLENHKFCANCGNPINLGNNNVVGNNVDPVPVPTPSENSNTQTNYVNSNVVENDIGPVPVPTPSENLNTQTNYVNNNQFNNQNISNNINNGQFNNLNSSKNKKMNQTLIISVILFVGVIALLIFLGFDAIKNNKNSSDDKEPVQITPTPTASISNSKVLTCTKDGVKLDQTLVLTYKNDQLEKWSVLYEIDTNVDENTLSESEVNDLMMVGFSQFGFANYSGIPGVTYSYDDLSDITTTEFTLDLNVASNEVALEILPEDERLSYSDALSQSRSEGYICK